MGNAKSAVIVVSGVNGVGKTTSIGKLGKYFKDNNRSVVFGAPKTTDLLLSLKYFPSFPILVVFPTPFTPDTTITADFAFPIRLRSFSYF